MNWALIGTGFVFGTWKFMFVHWMVYAAYQVDSFNELIQVYGSSTAGAWVTMAVFFFGSSYFMKRAAEKKIKAMEEAKARGEDYDPFPPAKNSFVKLQRWFYWRSNRLIVWIKKNVGIYGVTLIGPLILSVPIGSIVCAKFYGNKRMTFPLMMIGTATYSAIMCAWIYTQL